MIPFRVIERFSQGATWLAVVAAALMALHVSAEILSRLVLGHGLTGTIETVSYYYMVAVTFLPLGRVQVTRSHIIADAIAVIFPRPVRPLTDLLGELIALAIVGLLLWASINTAIDKSRIGELVVASNFDLPIWPARWLPPIGLGAMWLAMLAQLISARFGRAHDPSALPVD